MIKKKAFAKLNLNLHVIPQKLSTGLFPISFLNCQIALADEINFKKKDQTIEFIYDNPQIPKKENLILKAAAFLHNLSSKKDGAKIILKKNIPMKAGLASGSADAACTIQGLIELWDLKLDKKQLSNVIEKLGKDVYYCSIGGLCEVQGTGEIITPLPFKLPQLWLVIVSPEEKKPSTEFMYKHLDIKKIGKNLVKLENLKKAIELKDKNNILINLHNDFEDYVLSKFIVVKKIKEDLRKQGALNTLLAGSGLTVTGFFNSKIEAEKAFHNLKRNHKNIYLTKTI